MAVRTAILTREWPPYIYGGAGVHVEHLVPELRKLIEVDVHCLGKPRDDAQAHQVPEYLLGANAALQTIGADLAMADAITGCDVAHSHTWYANLGGHLTGLLHGIPHVITAHSLEPRRPWKREQLGGGYGISSWVENTSYRNADAIIAVSAGMRADVLDCYPFVDPERVHVVHNGIDTQAYRRVDEVDALVSHGVDPEKPYVLFVGRITRQKGISHLLRAAQDFDESVPIVLCAASPDTPELGAEVATAIEALREKRSGVHWLNGHLERSDVRQLLSHALVFACPSVYEPLGIVNLEAMGCEAPVVASDVGGIPEVVVDGETGLLVHYDPADTAQFETDLAGAINELIADPARAARMGRAGRERAISDFGWDRIAARTVEVYETAQGVHGG